MYIGSEPLNTVYGRLAQRAEELATGFPEVEESLSEFLAVFPDLYQAIGHRDSPGENWEFGQDIVRALKARVSRLYATVVPIDEEPGEDVDKIQKALEAALIKGDSEIGAVLNSAGKDAELINTARESTSQFSKKKRQYEERWLKQVEAAGKSYPEEESDRTVEANMHVPTTVYESLDDQFLTHHPNGAAQTI